MTLLKCATHVVADVDAAAARFARWMDYVVVEDGTVSTDLAGAWDAPASAGRRFVLMRPASGTPVFLRFIAGDPVPDYLPIRTFGWAAIELCVQDVAAVNDRMLTSGVFEVIGSPRPLEGYPTVKPMQVRGPDLETVYLTEIGADTPAGSGLPVPRSLIDRPFIMVLACRDFRVTAQWMVDVLGLDLTDPVAIRYKMIALAFSLPEEQRHQLVNAMWQGQILFEMDQYPPAATTRPRHDGALVPGVSLVSIVHPDFDRLEGHWLSPPVIRQGPLYAGRRVCMLRTPEGALLEVLEGPAAL